MRSFSIAVWLLLVLTAAPTPANSPIVKPKPSEVKAGISPGEVTPTPEMWFYQQYQHQYQDRSAMVRQNAELRASQRQHRAAALKWFGLSNQRPRVATDPVHSDYSPSWASNNGYYPYRWQGYGCPWILVPAGEAGK